MDKRIKVSKSPGEARIEKNVLRAFHRALAAWFARAARDLPWRRTRDPYAIALSEFMLQQTQVVTVLPYYHRWLRLFPDWKALAGAPTEAVLKTWEGLGYYQRARNFQKLAQAVAGLPELNGELPRTVEGLRALPGIGPYTAGAIASLAFGGRAALIDGNVIRVFTRVFGIGEDVALKETQARLWALAEGLLPEAEACAVHNSALMELGALICTPRNPGCLLCPLASVCVAKASGEPERFPVKGRKLVERREEVVALIEEKGRYWCVPGPKKGRLVGFWHFPLFDAATMRGGETVAEFDYSITKYRVHMRGLRAAFASAGRREEGGGRWCSMAEMEALPMPSAHRKMRGFLGS
ncbi:A/G-specific DNA-adenine glycosylase [Verrucomicrobium sp. GAS474]|uniref:A/G-specific adenine glycosylase n=1 Tax=Verrucomicrobium sp. GAS474 TaxID=1882831 RepID=UPI00087D4E37|nr:A/G-specific adenine glycosylase [Verrucomicrobium sp. GAS474]SDU07612.1 A/G-specific DNA-adenine glycosylase [Verrucomicrobium sp. GAS474]